MGDSTLPAIGDLADRIRSGTPQELLDLADQLDAHARTHQLAHESSIQGGSGEHDERVRLYPSELQIAADAPTSDTAATLGTMAHLVETSHDGEASIYQISPIDVWTSPYRDAGALLDELERLVGEVPDAVVSQVERTMERGTAFQLTTHDDGYSVLSATDEDLFESVAKEELEHNTHYTAYVSDTAMRIRDGAEAAVKERLYEAGYPPQDVRDLTSGESLEVSLSDDLALRDYQQAWVDRFMEVGSGVIDAPPGSGKTIAAIAILAALGQEALIITPSRELCSQWYAELRQHLQLGMFPDDNLGEYHGGEKTIAPITITTYDMASQARHGRKLFDREWGLVIYDECHHTPASVWRRTADIQSRHRLGLTATPVREDGESDSIFTLIGRPLTTTWEELYAEGWVHRPNVEVRFVPWSDAGARDTYQTAEGTQRMIAAAQNPAKLTDTQRLLDGAPDATTLIYCGWREQGSMYAETLDIPFIHGDTPHGKRDAYYDQLRDGDRRALIVSRIADEGIDLPTVDMVIIASMLGGSRRQGTQRVGRVMRPLGGADAYLLATRGSVEEQYARSQMDHLRERGTIVSETEVDA